MYKFQYKNKISGASVFSHHPIDRQDLEFVREFTTEELPVKTTNMNPSQIFTKAEVFTKPRVITLKRK